MIQIGQYNDLKIMREVDFGLYLGDKDEDVLLPTRYVPDNARIGDTLKVFVYTDSEDRPIATTLTPLATVDEHAYLAVKEITRIGAFMDWGLEKDLLVPLNEQRVKMNPGQSHVVRVCFDPVTDRVFGSTRLGALSAPVPEGTHPGQKVDLLIYDISEIGILAVVDNAYSGMLYRNETFEKLNPGDKRTGYILKVREDGKVDLSLKKPGYTSVSASAETILNTLNDSDGFLPCHDKSSPETIKKHLGMSKKEFKRAIGNLYKNNLIDITETGICLRKK